LSIKINKYGQNKEIPDYTSKTKVLLDIELLVKITMCIDDNKIPILSMREI